MREFFGPPPWHPPPQPSGRATNATALVANPWPAPVVRTPRLGRKRLQGRRKYFGLTETTGFGPLNTMCPPVLGGLGSLKPSLASSRPLFFVGLPSRVIALNLDWNFLFPCPVVRAPCGEGCFYPSPSSWTLASTLTRPEPGRTGTRAGLYPTRLCGIACADF